MTEQFCLKQKMIEGFQSLAKEPNKTLLGLGA